MIYLVRIFCYYDEGLLRFLHSLKRTIVEQRIYMLIIQLEELTWIEN